MLLFGDTKYIENIHTTMCQDVTSTKIFFYRATAPNLNSGIFMVVDDADLPLRLFVFINRLWECKRNMSI